MPAMLTPYRLISPLLAAALAILPIQSVGAAPAPASTTAAPAEAPPAAEGDAAGADNAAPVEGAEGDAAPGEPVEPEPAEPAEPEPAEAAPEPEAPAIPEGPKRPEEPKVGGKPATGKGLLIAGSTILAVGIGLTITSVLLTRCPELSNTVGCKYNEQRDFLVPVSASVLTAGALILAVGVGFKIRHDRWKRWTPESEAKKGKKVKESALVPTLVPGGGGLGYVGRF